MVQLYTQDNIMAKIHEEVLVIKISVLLPDHADVTPVMGNENIQALEDVVKQLVNDERSLVEIERA
jgi:hypothetical protein